MSKKITVANRINIGLGLTMVFLLVLATNRIDKKHFDVVQNSITTLHKDRILAQDYVYKMNGIIYEKRLILADSNSTNIKKGLNKQFKTLIEVFSTTKLTINESKNFESLLENFERLQKAETSNNKSSEIELDYLKAIKTDLDNLAMIQISESKNIIGLTQKSLNNKNLISKLEIGFLISIGIVLQIIIFYRVKKTNPKK